jgi:hypothetical protein
MRNSAILVLMALFVPVVTGCSRHDAPPNTPVYRASTPTNRSTVRMTDIHTEPYYMQPGVRGGAPVTLPPSPAYHDFEPNDPLAGSVYAALAADRHIPMRYLSLRARNGVVILEGTVDSADQKARAETIGRAVAGVKELQCGLKVRPRATAQR